MTLYYLDEALRLLRTVPSPLRSLLTCAPRGSLTGGGVGHPLPPCARAVRPAAEREGGRGAGDEGHGGGREEVRGGRRVPLRPFPPAPPTLPLRPARY
eukprot:2179104-Rhodomonas_salina.2